MSEHKPRSILYGRRKSHKLSPRQQWLLGHRLPNLSLSPPHAPDFTEWIAAARSGYEALWLEVGFGKGEHLAEMAGMHSDTLFIGCEPYINGVASLLGKIEDRRLDNILIHPGDAREVIEMMPEASIDRIFIIHPDPWPKRRHWKRRFIDPRTAAGIARVLCDKGELHIASDDASYLAWMLMHLGRQTALEWTAVSADDWRNRPPGFPGTRYSRKAETLGRRSIYLNFRRVARDART